MEAAASEGRTEAAGAAKPMPSEPLSSAPQSAERGSSQPSESVANSQPASEPKAARAQTGDGTSVEPPHRPSSIRAPDDQPGRGNLDVATTAPAVPAEPADSSTAGGGSASIGAKPSDDRVKEGTATKGLSAGPAASASGEPSAAAAQTTAAQGAAAAPPKPIAGAPAQGAAEPPKPIAADPAQGTAAAPSKPIAAAPAQGAAAAPPKPIAAAPAQGAAAAPSKPIAAAPAATSAPAPAGSVPPLSEATPWRRPPSSVSGAGSSPPAAAAPAKPAGAPPASSSSRGSDGSSSGPARGAGLLPSGPSARVAAPPMPIGVRHAGHPEQPPAQPVPGASAPSPAQARASYPSPAAPRGPPGPAYYPMPPGPPHYPMPPGMAPPPLNPFGPPMVGGPMGAFSTLLGMPLGPPGVPVVGPPLPPPVMGPMGFAPSPFPFPPAPVPVAFPGVPVPPMLPPPVLTSVGPDGKPTFTVMNPVAGMLDAAQMQGQPIGYRIEPIYSPEEAAAPRPPPPPAKPPPPPQPVYMPPGPAPAPGSSRDVRFPFHPKDRGRRYCGWCRLVFAAGGCLAHARACETIPWSERLAIVQEEARRALDETDLRESQDEILTDEIARAAAIKRRAEAELSGVAPSFLTKRPRGRPSLLDRHLAAEARRLAEVASRQYTAAGFERLRREAIRDMAAVRGDVVVSPPDSPSEEPGGGPSQGPSGKPEGPSHEARRKEREEASKRNVEKYERMKQEIIREMAEKAKAAVERAAAKEKSAAALSAAAVAATAAATAAAAAEGRGHFATTPEAEETVRARLQVAPIAPRPETPEDVEREKQSQMARQEAAKERARAAERLATLEWSRRYREARLRGVLRGPGVQRRDTREGGAGVGTSGHEPSIVGSPGSHPPPQEIKSRARVAAWPPPELPPEPPAPAPASTSPPAAPARPSAPPVVFAPLPPPPPAKPAPPPLSANLPRLAAANEAPPPRAPARAAPRAAPSRRAPAPLPSSQPAPAGPQPLPPSALQYLQSTTVNPFASLRPECLVAIVEAVGPLSALAGCRLHEVDRRFRAAVDAAKWDRLDLSREAFEEAGLWPQTGPALAVLARRAGSTLALDRLATLRLHVGRELPPAAAEALIESLEQAPALRHLELEFGRPAGPPPPAVSLLDPIFRLDLESVVCGEDPAGVLEWAGGEADCLLEALDSLCEPARLRCLEVEEMRLSADGAERLARLAPELRALAAAVEDPGELEAALPSLASLAKLESLRLRAPAAAGVVLEGLPRLEPLTGLAALASLALPGLPASGAEVFGEVGELRGLRHLELEVDGEAARGEGLAALAGCGGVRALRLTARLEGEPHEAGELLGRLAGHVGELADRLPALADLRLDLDPRWPCPGAALARLARGRARSALRELRVEAGEPAAVAVVAGFERLEELHLRVNMPTLDPEYASALDCALCRAARAGSARLPHQCTSTGPVQPGPLPTALAALGRLARLRVLRLAAHRRAGAGESGGPDGLLAPAAAAVGCLPELLDLRVELPCPDAVYPPEGAAALALAAPRALRFFSHAAVRGPSPSLPTALCRAACLDAALLRFRLQREHLAPPALRPLLDALAALRRAHPSADLAAALVVPPGPEAAEDPALQAAQALAERLDLPFVSVSAGP